MRTTRDYRYRRWRGDRRDAGGVGSCQLMNTLPSPADRATAIPPPRLLAETGDARGRFPDSLGLLRRRRALRPPSPANQGRDLPLGRRQTATRRCARHRRPAWARRHPAQLPGRQRAGEPPFRSSSPASGHRQADPRAGRRPRRQVVRPGSAGQQVVVRLGHRGGDRPGQHPVRVIPRVGRRQRPGALDVHGVVVLLPGPGPVSPRGRAGVDQQPHPRPVHVDGVQGGRGTRPAVHRPGRRCLPASRRPATRRSPGIAGPAAATTRAGPSRRPRTTNSRVTAS